MGLEEVSKFKLFIANLSCHFGPLVGKFSIEMFIVEFKTSLPHPAYYLYSPMLLPTHFPACGTTALNYCEYVLSMQLIHHVHTFTCRHISLPVGTALNPCEYIMYWVCYSYATSHLQKFQRNFSGNGMGLGYLCGSYGVYVAVMGLHIHGTYWQVATYSCPVRAHSIQQAPIFRHLKHYGKGHGNLLSWIN